MDITKREFEALKTRVENLEKREDLRKEEFKIFKTIWREFRRQFMRLDKIIEQHKLNP